MHAALAVVARHFGLPPILPDAAGHAELVVEEALPIFLRVADEFELELAARLPEFSDHLSPEVLEELLRWNGRMLGPRFSIQPDRGTVILGRRVDIRAVDPARLPTVIEDFVLVVAEWRRSGVGHLLERVKRHGATGETGLMSALR